MILPVIGQESMRGAMCRHLQVGQKEAGIREQALGHIGTDLEELRWSVQLFQIDATELRNTVQDLLDLRDTATVIGCLSLALLQTCCFVGF